MNASERVIPYMVPRPAPSRDVLTHEPPALPNPLCIPSVWLLESRIEWLVADMIPLRAVTLISAPSGTGKTWLSYALAGAVARGTPFLGLAVSRRSVLYLDGENPLAVAKRNLTDLGIPETGELLVWGGWHSEVPGPGVDVILKYAQDYKPFLIWDSLVHFHDGDEQSATETRAFMNFFRVLANAGATVLILHHTGKAESSKQYRGSSDIEASVDMAYTIVGTPKDGKVHRLHLKNFKSRFAPGRNFLMEFRSGQGFQGVELPQETQKPSADSVVTGIIAGHPEGINGTEIKALAKVQGLGKNAVDEFLKTHPSKTGRGREKLYFPIASPDS